MPLYTNLESLSQTPGANAADGSVDPPSTIDNNMNLLASFIARIRDGVYTLGGPLAMGLQKITGLADGTNNADAVNLAQLNTASGARVAKNGDTMTGDLVLQKNGPTIALDKNSFAQTAAIQGKSGTVLQYSLALGDSVGDFWINQYDGSGSFLRQPFRYTSAGAMTLNGTRIDVSAPDIRIIGIGTTASGANLYQDPSGGNVYRSTSSLRYKRDVEPMEPARAEKILDGVEAIWYRSKSEVDRQDWSWYGLSAEKTAKADPRLVSWIDIDGKLVPDGVMYERFVAPLILRSQGQKKLIAQLIARIEALEKKA